MSPNPLLYEINARLFTSRLSTKYQRRITLGSVPDSEWGELARLGFDLVWLMGVWQRSPASRRIALLEKSLREAYDTILPGWTEAEITGSPYAVYDYILDAALGDPAELMECKANLNRHGIGLILDFVPNHLSVDHPWVTAYPDRFVQGTEIQAAVHPDWFFSPSGDIYLAHGKDPYFPPWSDTVQINFFSGDSRRALIEELLKITRVADGVRCDMAMLGLNDIFARVWGSFVKDTRPSAEFWTEAISAVRKWHPDFMFMAEVYWGRESELQQLGFDYTYDKTLYDRLHFAGAKEVRQHLNQDGDFHRHCVHFIENHDEQRAITALGKKRSLAAAVVIATLPGTRMFFDGQMEGKQTRLPVQLACEPDEPVDPEIYEFYRRLLAACTNEVFRDGDWRLLDIASDGDDQSYVNLLAWCWSKAGKVFLVVVTNYSGEHSRGIINLPFPIPERLEDILTGEFQNPRTGEQQTSLYCDLGTYQSKIYQIVGKSMV